MENFKQNKLRDFLNSKWQNAKCPICSEPLQTVEATVLELREFNDGNLVVGGPSGGCTSSNSYYMFQLWKYSLA